MLDDAVVVFGEAQLVERVVESAARSDEKHRHMQPASSVWRFFFVGQGVLLAASAEAAGPSAELALAPSADAHVAVDADVHQQAKSQHHRDHSGSAVGNQR